jgi:uncharacterized alpha/beta hydrolase family protein
MAAVELIGGGIRDGGHSDGSVKASALTIQVVPEVMTKHATTIQILWPTCIRHSGAAHTKISTNAFLCMA